MLTSINHGALCSACNVLPIPSPYCHSPSQVFIRISELESVTAFTQASRIPSLPPPRQAVCAPDSLHNFLKHNSCPSFLCCELLSGSLASRWNHVQGLALGPFCLIPLDSRSPGLICPATLHAALQPLWLPGHAMHSDMPRLLHVAPAWTVFPASAPGISGSSLRTPLRLPPGTVLHDLLCMFPTPAPLWGPSL